MDKQAILIMYHNEYYLLTKLLKLLDNSKFDIYLHIDKKVKNFDYDTTKKLLKKSHLYFTKRLNVKWSTFSQIECELLLLKEATKNNYQYYHLISGVDLPIKTSDEIYEFFSKNYPQEFVAYKDFDKASSSDEDRIKYYHILNRNRRHHNKFIQKISITLYYRFLTLQKKLKVNRLKNKHLKIRKGANWFSITNECAKYILDNEKLIRKNFKHSNCADELFIQTILVDSKFYPQVYHKYPDELKNIQRHIDWKRGEPYTFKEDDYEELINSSCMFARKFSQSTDIKIIDKIYNYLKAK